MKNCQNHWQFKSDRYGLIPKCFLFQYHTSEYFCKNDINLKFDFLTIFVIRFEKSKRPEKSQYDSWSMYVGLKRKPVSLVGKQAFIFYHNILLSK